MTQRTQAPAFLTSMQRKTLAIITLLIAGGGSQPWPR